MSKHEPAGRGLLFSVLLRSEIRLYNVVDERLRRDCELPLGHYAMLRCVEEIPGCRVGDIAAQMAITVGATSRSVDRLEAQGLAQRRPNPANRRSSIIVMTPAGAAKLTEAAATIEDELAGWFDPELDGAERHAITDGLGRVLTRLQDAGAGRPTG